jgi:uncharacterized phage protein (TIGR02218 family)
MKSGVSAALQTHLAGEVTTLATCWKITLRDTTVMGFTDYDSDIVFGGVTYGAATGYKASAIQTSSQADVDNLELLGVIDQSQIVATDVQAGRWDFAQVEIFWVNYMDLTQGRLLLRKGTLGEIKRGKTMFRAELRGLSQALTQSHGRLIMPSCDADLGDARCGINLATFPNGTRTGALTSVTSRRIFADSAIGMADGWFDGGLIRMTSGANNTQAREVKTYLFTGGAITLQESFPYNLAVGDSYSMTAGCLKRFAEDCVAKFNNAVNFRGFPHMPGTDRMITGQ